MAESKRCTELDPKTGETCQGIMEYAALLPYPGDRLVGRGLGQPLNLPDVQRGPGWRCNVCGHVEPDRPQMAN